MSTAEIDTARGAYAPVPGPLDRESFFAAQARNRRATWRLTALCAVAVLLLGLPLSTVLSPLIYGAFFLGMDVVNLVTPTPDLLKWAFDRMDEADAASQNTSGDPTPAEITSTVLAAAAVLVPPGAAGLLLIWLGVRALFLRAGVGGILLTLGAREPRLDDLEEAQLVNVVAEMAIAAGVPPPRVMLLDSPVPNAAAVGSSMKDGVVIVSRGLLDQLDRDETQGIVGHLIGSVGNGDLRIAMTLLSLFQTMGVIVALLTSPYGPKARGVVWRLIRFAFGRRGDAREAEAINGLLARMIAQDDSSDLDQMDKGRFGKIKSVLSLPFLMAYMAFWLNQQILGGLLVGPLLALTWRTRRYLADATAVQLTRNPDGLSRALERLVRQNAAIPGAAWASYLFVTWPHVIGARDTFAAKAGIMARLHPPHDRRMLRLNRMGAAIRPPDRRWSPAKVLGYALFSPLAVLLAGLLLAACGLLLMISLAIDGMFLFGLIVVPLHALLRALAS